MTTVFCVKCGRAGLCCTCRPIADTIDHILDRYYPRGPDGERQLPAPGVVPGLDRLRRRRR